MIGSVLSDLISVECISSNQLVDFVSAGHGYMEIMQITIPLCWMMMYSLGLQFRSNLDCNAARETASKVHSIALLLLFKVNF